MIADASTTESLSQDSFGSADFEPIVNPAFVKSSRNSLTRPKSDDILPIKFE